MTSRRLRPIFASLGLILAILTTARAHAQQQDEQLWLQVNTNVPVDDGVRVTLEQIARFSDAQEGLYQSEIGALLGIKLARNVELGLGYRWVGAHNGNTNANENRFRQQVVATFGPVTTRLRVDERFNPRGDEIGFRIRPLVRYNHRLGGTKTALFASHESIILPNGTRWGQRRGYERMRNIVGVAVPLGRGVTADVGYLNQYRLGRDGARDQVEHALNLQLTIDLKNVDGPRVND